MASAQEAVASSANGNLDTGEEIRQSPPVFFCAGACWSTVAARAFFAPVASRLREVGFLSVALTRLYISLRAAWLNDHLVNDNRSMCFTSPNEKHSQDESLNYED
jgi:hypothetical protein